MQFSQVQKPYKVGCVPGRPNLDSAPVAKITGYPLEKRDYRPFAQCVLCLGDGRLFLRMWAFEVSPMPTSALACVLYCFRERPALALRLCVEHGRGDIVGLGVHLLEDGAETPVGPALERELFQALEHHPHNGEDLQGVYWGMTLALPIRNVVRLGGETLLRPGAVFPGNFYKTCAHERFAHMGSYFPADFPDRPASPGSMGEFHVVSY